MFPNEDRARSSAVSSPDERKILKIQVRSPRAPHTRATGPNGVCTVFSRSACPLYPYGTIRCSGGQRFMRLSPVNLLIRLAEGTDAALDSLDEPVRYPTLHFTGVRTDFALKALPCHRAVSVGDGIAHGLTPSLNFYVTVLSRDSGAVTLVTGIVEDSQNSNSFWRLPKNPFVITP